MTISPDTDRELHIRRHREIFPPLSQEHAAAIGYVASEWSLIDSHISSIIRSLLGLSGRASESFIADMNVVSKMGTIRALITLTGDEELRDSWKVLSAETDRLRVKRNTILHSTWEVVNPSQRFRSIKGRGTVRIAIKIMLTSELMKDYDDMTYLSDRLAQFTVHCFRKKAPEILKGENPPGFLPEHLEVTP